MSTRLEVWIPRGSLVYRRGRTPQSARASLIAGTYKPSAATTGTIPGTTLTPYYGDITMSAGQLIENRDIFGRVTVNAANCTLRNCRVRGNIATLSTYTALVTATGQNVKNLLVEDCELTPDVPDYRWDGMYGHDFTARRLRIHHVQDGFQVKVGYAIWPFPTNVRIEGCWVSDLAWWSYGTNGTVHPSDTVTHNDPIQHMQGTGTWIVGNILDGRYARNYGHWFVVGNPNVEPYVTVPMNSLSDNLNGPWRHIWDRGLDSSEPTGNEATGRYNWGNLSNMIIGAELSGPTGNKRPAPSIDLHINDNWLYGSQIGLNFNGDQKAYLSQYPDFVLGSTKFAEMKRNRFSRDQGGQASGGNATLTIYGPQSGWTPADADIPLTGPDANVYEDNGQPVRVRLAA